MFRRELERRIPIVSRLELELRGPIVSELELEPQGSVVSKLEHGLQAPFVSRFELEPRGPIKSNLEFVSTCDDALRKSVVSLMSMSIWRKLHRTCRFQSVLS